MSVLRGSDAQSWARWAMLVGLVLAAVGYLGPWVAHPTAGLTLTGPDLGEFVKFLPGGAPPGRQLFYAPAVAVALLVALYAQRYPWVVRAPLLLVGLLMSLQLLPPAWNLAVLRSSELRAQTLALAACWILLAAHAWLGRVPRRWSGVGATLASLAAGILITWQYLRLRPAVGAVYSASAAYLPVGWGVVLCLTGLVAAAGAGLVRGPNWRRGTTSRRESE